METMNILFLGGDSRYLELINNLKDKYDIDTVGYDNICIDNTNNINLNNVDISLYDTIIFPINGVNPNNMISCQYSNCLIQIPDNLLVNSKENVLILSGISTPTLDKMLDISKRKCVYMMRDKEVVKENAILTVEGIIADLINNTDKSLNECKILVLGYGNVGSILVNYLQPFGSDIFVSIIDANDKDKLDKMQVKCFYSNSDADLINCISGVDIIVNTVPKQIIGDSLVKYINRECYILDIASYPYGFNSEVLDRLSIKNKIYSGIPGKVAPKTAGKILTKKINKIMEEY